MKFSEWLQANEIEAEGLSEKASAKLKAQYDAEMLEAERQKEHEKGSVHGRSFIATLEAEKKEKARVETIDELAAAAVKANPTQIDTIEKLVKAAHGDRNCDPKDFELGLLRATRPVGPTPFMSGNSDSGINAKVVTAAICKSLGLKSIEKQFDERTLDATDRHFRHGIGLQQLLFRAAAANGQHFDSVANLRPLLRASFGDSDVKASGFSTFSLPGIFADVMNKTLLDYFNGVEATWREISATRPVRDFRQINSYSLTGDLQYQELSPTGEIQHGTLGEESYTNQAKTYAKMLAITRADIINDDLGALQRVPQRLGRGGALKINDVFWTVFLDNSTFFAAGNSNVSTGGGSALGTSDGAAINAAEVIFKNQTDPDGKPLGVMPRLMLVPPTLLNTAARWMGGQLIVTGASSTLPNVNVYQGRYRVVSSAYMENSSYTGYSAAAWYLLADPMDMPVIETVFLNGNQTPTVESADADFDQLGIQVRAYHDFGVALQEPRGGVRSAGS